MSAQIPVLLTSSVVAHDRGVAVTDTQERTRLALESVREWLKIDPQLQLVLCDGSGFDFGPLVREQFPLAQIECLHFENDVDKVRAQGRGFGEGEIVRYAVDHSTTIARAGCFAKCTSKLWVENFSECVVQWNDELLLKGVFDHVFSIRRTTSLLHIDTRFYIASVKVYRRDLIDAHQHIRRDQGHGLEECFREVLVKKSLRRVLLSVAPVICGVGGGTGVYYKNSLKRTLKERLRLALVRRNPAFRDLFV
jgi:hypothetical protein